MEIKYQKMSNQELNEKITKIEDKVDDLFFIVILREIISLIEDDFEKQFGGK